MGLLTASVSVLLCVCAVKLTKGWRKAIRVAYAADRKELRARADRRAGSLSEVK